MGTGCVATGEGGAKRSGPGGGGAAARMLSVSSTGPPSTFQVTVRGFRSGSVTAASRVKNARSGVRGLAVMDTADGQTVKEGGRLAGVSTVTVVVQVTAGAVPSETVR